jgi:hypothetical protein
MFDLRYHVASLAAVLLAIAVGIVIGVAIASGGEVEKRTLDLRESQIADLEQQLEAAQAQAEQSNRDQGGIEDLVEQSYSALMENRLSGKEVAVVFLGPLDGGLRRDIEKTLTDARAGSPVRVTALELPIDVTAIDDLLDDDSTLAAYVGDAQLGDLGEALGRELVFGGETPLWDLLDDQIVEERTGALTSSVDGVVVARSWIPEETEDPAEEGRHSQTEALLVGLLRGLNESGLPVVGVEESRSELSTVGAYRDVGISSVDNVDTLAGRMALGLLLAGGEPGTYGTKDSADAVLPPIEPLTVATVVE